MFSIFDVDVICARVRYIFLWHIHTATHISTAISMLSTVKLTTTYILLPSLSVYDICCAMNHSVGLGLYIIYGTTGNFFYKNVVVYLSTLQYQRCFCSAINSYNSKLITNDSRPPPQAHFSPHLPPHFHSSPPLLTPQHTPSHFDPLTSLNVFPHTSLHCSSHNSP